MVTSNTQWFMYFCKYLEDPCQHGQLHHTTMPIIKTSLGTNYVNRYG